jgi:hypothetical protein
MNIIDFCLWQDLLLTTSGLPDQPKLDHPSRHIWRRRLLDVPQIAAAGRLALPLTGASARHEQITGEMVRELAKDRKALANSPCRRSSVD